VEDDAYLPFYGVNGGKGIIVKDRERALEEINSLLFKTLYLRTAAYVSFLTISYIDFFVFFFLLLASAFSCIVYAYLEMLYAFNAICRLLINKNANRVIPRTNKCILGTYLLTLFDYPTHRIFPVLWS
jgi:hypothetical protein